MATASDIASQIRAALLATDPELDTSVGTTTRKIIDAVSEQIAEAYIDNHLLAYQYDVNSKSGADLDAFVALFGMTRYAAKRATGTVVFSRTTGSAAREEVSIPVNTMVGNPAALNTEAQTVSPAHMVIGQTSVTVPVVAVQGGPTGNIGAGLLTQVLTPTTTLLSVTNIEPLSGGTDEETDDDLRLRWKKTVFRSLAGTEQMFLGIALDDGELNGGVGCYAANVVGASKRHREQVQISGGVAYSQVQDIGYSYALSPVFGADIDGGVVMVRDQDYTFDTTVNPPRVVMLVSTYWDGTFNGDGSKHMVSVEGAILDLEFEYAPTSTRNDPGNGINNRIDVYCAGQRPQTATQAVSFNSAIAFSASTTSPYYVGYYFRDSTGTAPTATNVLIPLAFGPIMTIPGTITIGTSTYVENVHYWLVHQDIPYGLSSKSLFGLEWDSASIPGGTPTFSLDYTYNEVPKAVQTLIDRWRLVGTDALAHQAKEQYLRFNIAIMYDRGVTKTVVNDGIRTAISKFLSKIGFAGVVQVSDILNEIHKVPGVDNVRFLNGSDYSGYNPATPNAFGIAIQLIGPSGAVLTTFSDSDGSGNSPLGRPVDIEFGDAEVPVFHSLGGGGTDLPLVKAQNTFGV